MAGNLVEAGFDVIGHNRSPEPIQRLVEQGGRGAGSLAEAVRDADVVVTRVPDSPDVEAVTIGEDGFSGLVEPGTLHVDMSSIRPDVARRVAEAGRDRGGRVLNAPVSGGQQGAIDGTLSIMDGGSPEDFADGRPVLEAVGETVVHVGPAGSGRTVKAANQLIVAGTIELVAEAIVFLEAHGVDTEAAVEVLAGGLAGTRSSTARPRRCCAATSSPASASSCTTRTCSGRRCDRAPTSSSTSSTSALRCPVRAWWSPARARWTNRPCTARHPPASLRPPAGRTCRWSRSPAAPC